jgi:hypothetical protein
MYRQVVKQFDLSEDGRAVLDLILNRWYPNVNLNYINSLSDKGFSNVLLREFSRGGPSQVLNYIIKEILTLSINHARDHKRDIVNSWDILNTISNDTEIGGMLLNYIPLYPYPGFYETKFGNQFTQKYWNIPINSPLPNPRVQRVDPYIMFLALSINDYIYHKLTPDQVQSVPDLVNGILKQIYSRLPPNYTFLDLLNIMYTTPLPLSMIDIVRYSINNMKIGEWFG